MQTRLGFFSPYLTVSQKAILGRLDEALRVEDRQATRELTLEFLRLCLELTREAFLEFWPALDLRTFLEIRDEDEDSDIVHEFRRLLWNGENLSPFAVRLRGRELPLEHIGRHRQAGVRLRRHHPPAAFAVRGPDVVPAHQPRHTLAVAGEAAAEQLAVHARAAVTMAHLPIDLPDRGQESCVLLPAPAATLLARDTAATSATAAATFQPAALAPAPGLVAAGRHLQHAAQPLDRVLVGVDHYEPVPGFAGCEKMAIAFFKISRSCRRIAFSRCSRPCPGNASAPSHLAARPHCFSNLWLKPSSRSSSVIVYLLDPTSSTAARLNSLSYFCRPGILVPPDGQSGRIYLSVHHNGGSSVALRYAG